MPQKCESSERIVTLEVKLDRVLEDLGEMKADVKANKESLVDHMRRTELVEKGIEDFRKKFYMMLGAFVLFQILQTGGVDALVKAAPFLLKLFGL